MALSRDLRALRDGWAAHQRLLVDALRRLGDEQLKLSPAPGQWAVWQIASHIAGARAYWLCDVLGDADSALRDRFRVEQTTVPGLPLEDAGWEDDEAHPRTAEEIVAAIEDTWAAVMTALESGTPETLHAGHPRLDPGETRAWVTWHLIEHDVHHGGQISLILGSNGIAGLNI